MDSLILRSYYVTIADGISSPNDDWKSNIEEDCPSCIAKLMIF